MEEGAKVFGSHGEIRRQQKKIVDLERLVGQKKIETALLKTFWARADHLGES